MAGKNSEPPHNLGAPDDESAGADQEEFDEHLAGKSDEELGQMVEGLFSQMRAKKEPPSHEDTAAAALHELLGEDADAKGPPDWYRKAWENT